MNPEQDVWIREVQKGNDLAAQYLYEQYAKQMFSTLLRMVSDRELAKDLLQEAFVLAFRRINQLDEPAAFGGWLKRIVVNLALGELRKKKWEWTDLGEETEEEMEWNTQELSGEQIHQIHTSIQTLPQGCRSVLNLYLLEGFTHDEIADEMNISVSTSKTQYRYAKKLLKEKLAHIYEID